MSKITQLNLDGALLEVKDPRFENDKFFQYNLGTISETPDTSQNETLQKIYDAAASGGSVMAIYDGILLDVSEVSADKMVLSSSSGLTFLKINATVAAGVVTEAVRISTTPIIYGEVDYEDGVTPLPTGTIYCYWGGTSDVDPEGLTFTSDNPFTLKFAGNGGYSTPANIEMTTNGNDWSQFNSASVITFDSAMNTATGKHTIAVRSNDYINDVSDSEYVTDFYTFTSTNGSNISVSKNLSYITGGKNYTNTPAVFAHLFAGFTELVDASQMVMDTLTGLPYNICNQMFANCTKLTQVCNINLAETIDKAYDRCFYNMFAGCSSLETSISFKLPPILERSACFGMFDGCSKMNPIIDFSSTTTMRSWSCERMFAGTKVVEPADLSQFVSIGFNSENRTCYEMYMNCTELKYPANIQPYLDSVAGNIDTDVSDLVFIRMYANCTKIQFSTAATVRSIKLGDYYDWITGEVGDDAKSRVAEMFLGVPGAPSWQGEEGTPGPYTYYFKEPVLETNLVFEEAGGGIAH